MLSYTLFFILSIFGLVCVGILLDGLEHSRLKKEYGDDPMYTGTTLYVHVFKVLVQVATIWLIIAFIGQILMGWIAL